MKFEWDFRKEESNLLKHGVSFHEAGTALGDPLSVTFPDSESSVGEARYITIGESVTGKLLVVVHTDRYENIRIISARKATRKERRFYEENKI